MYIDAAERKIKDQIDYLIEAEKKSRKLALPLALAGLPELATKADVLRREILTVIDAQPIEAWETVSGGNRNSRKTQSLPPESEYTVEQLQSISRKQWFGILTPSKRELLMDCYSTLHSNTNKGCNGGMFGGCGFSTGDIQQATLFYDALKDDSCAEHILGPSIVFLHKYRNQLYILQGVLYPDCLFEESA